MNPFPPTHVGQTPVVPKLATPAAEPPVPPPPTDNLYRIAQAADGRLVMNRVMTRVLTPADAINLACWLLHFADPELVAFPPVFRGIPKDAK